MVGSGGDDELMPILEDALSVPVFAPAEAQLALARGAALASAQNVDFAFTDDAHVLRRARSPCARRRRQLGQTGPLALLVAGVLTFTVSASVAVSLQLAPKRTRHVRTAACRQDLSGDARRGHSPSGAGRDPTGTGRRGATATRPKPLPSRLRRPRLQRDAGRHSRGAAAVSDAPPVEAVPPEAAAHRRRPRGAVTPRAAGPARPACARRTPGNHQPDQGPAARYRRGRRHHPLPRSRHHRHLLPNSRRHRATPRPCCHLPDRQAEYAR